MTINPFRRRAERRAAERWERDRPNREAKQRLLAICEHAGEVFGSMAEYSAVIGIPRQTVDKCRLTAIDFHEFAGELRADLEGAQQ